MPRLEVSGTATARKRKNLQEGCGIAAREGADLRCSVLRPLLLGTRLTGKRQLFPVL